MRFNARPLSLLLALVVGASCSPGTLGPEDSSAPAGLPVGQSVRDASADSLSTVDLLLCSPQRYAITTRVVGPKGDKDKVGSHLLTIPAGALSENVTIVAEQLTDSVNSVRFGPEGLTFALPAQLTMSYGNCESVGRSKKLVYTDEQLKLLEVLNSDDKPQTKIVTSPIDHFSRYAVAY